ncbi:MAG: exodeoxyribonuclease VII large subunit [Pseudomonadota bacterium]
MTSSSGQTALSVSQINKQAGDLLNQAFGVVEVIGEVAEHKRAASGHHYFALKDERSQLRCAFFRGNAMRNRHPLREGEEVVVTGRLGIYSARGSYQLIVQSVAPAGEGRLAAEFERLRQRLLAEGLFDADGKRDTPVLPRRIAVISSDTGAAIHDVRVTLARRFPLARVTLFPVRVQGAGSAEQLRAAVAALTPEAFDVALLVRGGGSLTDLWSFNDEALVRAIHACPVPTISGVGHETDTTLCDLAADRRAATPTGAAELATPVPVAEMHERLGRLGERIAVAFLGGLETRAQRVDDLARGLARHGPGGGLRLERYRLAGLLSPLHRQVERQVATGRQALAGLRRRLERGHPRHRLARRRARLDELSRRRLVARERLLAGHRQRVERLVVPRQAPGERLRRERARVEALGRQLRALGPEQVQRRGYVLVESVPRPGEEGRLLKRAAELRALGCEQGGRLPLRLRFVDATVRADWREADDRAPAGDPA